MSEWNKPVFAQPGAGMSISADDGLGHLNAITAPPRTGMSVLVNQKMLALASTSRAKPTVLEEASLTFRTRSGDDLLINPFDQSSIEAAKKAAPGEGVGPAVWTHLVHLIGRGLIEDANLLPTEYRHLGSFLGTTPAQVPAEAILANCNTLIQLKVRG